MHLHPIISALLAFIMIAPSYTVATPCHPAINPKLPQYIVGYGSLMDEQSKKSTDPTAMQSVPVVVKGYKRSWSVHGNLPGLNATFLCAAPDPSASLNGVIYQLNNPNQVAAYDKREATYCRATIQASHLMTYDFSLPTKKQIWMYVSNHRENEPPMPNYPIVQSYVDIFIRGCIQLEEHFKIKNFARDCVNMTDGWSPYWINDRLFPRRPFASEPYAPQIDALLKAQRPDEFKHIKIE
jgi:cation transport regulator ChaC